MSPAATSAKTIAEFKKQLKRLTSYNALIEQATDSATANADRASATAQAVAELPAQHEKLLALLRSDFLTSLDGQRTALDQAATSWNTALETRLQTAGELLNQVSETLKADLGGHTTTLRTETQQALKDAQSAVRDQLTTLNTMRGQYGEALTARDEQLKASLAEWGRQVSGLARGALEPLTVASEIITATLNEWNTRAEAQQAALAAIGAELNRILLGLNRFRDELDAARFVGRLEALTISLEQSRAQSQEQHGSVLRQSGELQSAANQHHRNLQQLAAQQEASTTSLNALVTQLLQSQRRASRLQTALLGGVALVAGLVVSLLLRGWHGG